MSEQLYRKVGKRYKPVDSWERLYELKPGMWLTVVEKGCNSTIPVKPGYATFYAAANKARKAMIAALQEAAEFRPMSTPITPKQRDAWLALKKSVGKNRWSVLQGASVQDIADAGIEAVRVAWEASR